MIRKAEMRDLVAMMKLGQTFWVQTKYYKNWGIPYHGASVAAHAAKCIYDGATFIDEEDGKINGMILVDVGTFPMDCRVLAATEWVFYIDPDKRGSKAATELIAASEAALKEMGVKLFSMISLSNVTPERAEKLYQHLGFEHSETAFTKEVI